MSPTPVLQIVTLRSHISDLMALGWMDGWVITIHLNACIDSPGRDVKDISNIEITSKAAPVAARLLVQKEVSSSQLLGELRKQAARLRDQRLLSQDHNVPDESQLNC